MSDKLLWRCVNPTEITLQIVHGYAGTVSNAKMHIMIAGADVNIDILRPRLISDIHSDLTELSSDLTEVSQVQFFRKSLTGGTLHYRIEIARKDEEIEIIRCDEIKGLPA